MPTNIGPIIGIDGEKEYRKQINQIIQQAKTLDAEMKAVTSAFESQNDSQKKLTAQSESLTKQIENQEKRIDLLQQMTDKAAQKYGEADTRTLKWRQAVADATTALNKMKSELSQVNQELEENASASGTSHLERLTGVIQDQERELDDLKVAYQEAVLAKGRDSQEAQDAARKIQSLSTDLKENKTDMQQLAREADSLAGELDGAGNSAKSFQDKMDAAFSTVDKIGTGLSVGVTAPLAALGTAGVKTYLDLNDAAVKLVVQTGAAAEETEKYQDILEEIYKGGYGEDYEDIANSMAKVRQNLGEMDDLNLSILTKDALAIRDTLDYDVSESTRAAKAMMDNFGVSAKDAFGYIITGAQNGLDYSGELLDSISEYSVQFAKVGFDADDMFNIFQQGYETGSWNLDKMGDAIKEFSIRVVDGSETTQQGFEAIGLNADQMSAKFAAGGESAKQAFQETVSALAEMKDPLDQNIAGVNLFGTMWEDLGPEVVTQLAEISDETYGAEGAMDALNDSMSDAKKAEKNMREAQSALSEIGDSLVSIGLPVLENFSDVLGDVSDWFDSLDDGGKNMVLTLGGIAVAAGPTVKAIGKIGSAVSGAKNFLDSFKSSADTAKQSVSDLDTSSKNTASNSGGISKLGSTLGTVFSGVGIVATGIGLVSGLVSWINDLNDAATNANFSHFSEQWDTINTGLSNAKSSLEDYNTQVFESNGKMATIEEDLRQVQADISTICTTASQQRRDLTQSEIDALEELFQTEQELTQQQLDLYQRAMDVAVLSAQMDLQQAANMDTDTFNQTLSENYKTMMDAYQQIATYSDTWLAQQEAQLYSYYESRGQLNSAEHQQAVADARAQAEQMKTEAQNQVAGMLEQWLGYYEDKYNLDELYYQKTETYNTSLSQEWAKYLAEMDRIRQDSTLSEYERQKQLESATDYFGGRMSNIYQNLTANMDEEERKALDTYIRWSSDTALWGGETSTEAQRMVQTIITAMDELPEETQTAMKESFNGAGQIIQQRAPGFIESCVGSFTGWVDDVFNLLGVNSPSRVMKQLFGYVMDGAEIGFDNGADNLLSKANRFTKDFEMALTPTLREYDKWMPDFAEGLARSAQRSLPTVSKIGDEIAQALTPKLPDYADLLDQTMAQSARLQQQAQAYADLQAGGITVNWDGYPESQPQTSTIQITINAAPGQSEEEIANAVAYRLQHQVQQQRRGRL